MYPLLFEDMLQPRVWGGRLLETKLGKTLTTDQPVGESWEVYFKNRVVNGQFAGKALAELIETHPVEMTGVANADPEFPLLIKFLDAQDWLSVQVHPDDALAVELEGEPRGKTECWYIIHAEPGAKLVYGFAEAIDAEGFRQAIADGKTRDVLNYVAVQSGDFVFVPAGTLHAIGPGLLIYELQQTSDTTYRVYDWDRMGLDGKPRELHIEKTIRCTHYEKAVEAGNIVRANSTSDALTTLTSPAMSRYFNLYQLRFTPGSQVHADWSADAPQTVTAIKGAVTLVSTAESTQFEPLTLRAGQSCFMPKAVGKYGFAPESDGELLIATPNGIPTR